ncbi:MAG: 5-formyltetrahydrofolate cyclo-ligase [Nitrospirota bacterium]
MRNVKQSIRKEILRKRDGISRDLRAEKDALIERRLLSLPEFTCAKTVLFYASFRSEVYTLRTISTALSLGKKVLLPKVDSKQHCLVLYEIRDVTDLSPGYMGIPEPAATADRETGVDDADLVIIPGAAFDRRGNRLGYGAGYYDILLTNSERKAPLITLAYEEQIVDSVPSEAHDVKVGIIVTDERVIRT